MASLSLDHVSKIYASSRRSGVRAVDDLTMHVDDGEIVGLLGSSGCGKTSTLRMIAGLESVTDGTIRVGARLINTLRASERNVAMAFEGYALYPPLKVGDNIAFSLLRDRMPKRQAAERVRQIAGLLEIEDILDRYPPTISGGQQQRVSLARALARQAAIHLLDEPMSQLEPQLRAILRARIKDFLIENRLTTLFVTHDQTEAIALADRIAVMEGGQLQQFGSPADLKERPANLFVASFIGEPPMNVFRAAVAAGPAGPRLAVLGEDGAAAFVLSLPEDAPPAAAKLLRPDQEIQVGIRPSRIRVGREATALGGNGAVARVAGTVFSNQWLGDQSHIGIRLKGLSLIAVADGTVSAPVDSEIIAALPMRALHVFDAATTKALLHGMVAVEG